MFIFIFVRTIVQKCWFNLIFIFDGVVYGSVELWRYTGTGFYTVYLIRFD